MQVLGTTRKFLHICMHLHQHARNLLNPRSETCSFLDLQFAGALGSGGSEAAGHSLSWGMGYPNLLTPCDDNGVPIPILDVANNNTFDTVRSVLAAASVFTDESLHLPGGRGGDRLLGGAVPPCLSLRGRCAVLPANCALPTVEGSFSHLPPLGLVFIKH